MVSFSVIPSILLLFIGRSGAFAPGSLSGTPLLSSSRSLRQATVITNLNAKKKGKKGGKGFGKEPPQSPAKNVNTQSMESSSVSEGGITVDKELVGLSSIEDATDFAQPEFKIDPNAPIEDRTKSILKQKYGLRSLEEQQGDIRAAERIRENSKRMKKIKEMTDEEFDIFEVIPPPILKFIDLFLKIGLTVTTLLFILGGIGITIEAWGVATQNSIPEYLVRFIEDIIEPNFTKGGIVLLGFSISLGIFATAQLGSKKSAYREDL